MNFRILCRLESVILFALSLAFANSFAVALWFSHKGHDEGNAVWGFAVTLLISLTLGIIFHLIGRTGSTKMFRKEALAVIGLGWLLASIMGAIPYWLILKHVGIADAIFESASGFTTTGASILSNLEQIPYSLLYWRSLSQWIGGLGVVVFFVAILSFLGSGAKILFSNESSAQHADLDSSRVQKGIYQLVYLYLGLSVLCTLTYKLCGLNWFESLNHMYTTLSTGGFSTRSASIAAFENPIFEWAVIFYMTLGGTSFVFILRFLKREHNLWQRSTEVRYYLSIIVIATALISVFIYSEPGIQNPHGAIRHAAFQVVSIMTTTGYATKDFDIWLPATKIILLILMVIGGCSGSTGGGIKVVRSIVGLRICQRQVERAYRTRVVRPIFFNGKSLDSEASNSIMSFLVLMGFVTIIGVLLVSLYEPHMSVSGTISATFACIFNIGPGFAEVGPSLNFNFLHDITKIILSLLMILGRLELYAVLALFAPSLWKKF